MNTRPLLTVVFSLIALSSVSAESISQPSDERPPGISPDTTENDQDVLRRLIAELERSPRSFRYLRSIGFTQTDVEFGRLITLNRQTLRSTHIVRVDEHGNRQIPGWPGVSLTTEYKNQHR